MRRAAPVWASPGRALDLARSRFLEAVDTVAPHVWQELLDGPTPRDAAGWAERHHLGAWAVPYVEDRLRRVLILGPASPWSGWLSLYGEPRPVPTSFAKWGEPDPPELPRLRPRFQNESDRAFTARKRRYERAARDQYLAAEGEARPDDVRDLERLARWQVLRQAPAAIAAAELDSGRDDALHHARTEEVRRAVERLAKRLRLPPRHRAAGRPRKTPH